MSWTISRRYNQFRALDAELQTALNGTFADGPQVPPKKYFGNTSHAVIEERKKSLEV